MQLQTDHLLLREFTPDDWSAVLAYQSDPRYLRYYWRRWLGPPYSPWRWPSRLRASPTRILILERLIHQILSRGRYDVFIARCLWGSA